VTRWARAAAVALTIWGSPTCGPVHHRAEWLPRRELGYATRPCTIVVTRRRLEWERYCATVVHEWGHLAGRRHSRDPRSIMFPRYHGEPRCRRH
jgi:hypothetical protein